MAKLHQIQIRFDPKEDRILLRIRTADESEFRFWLTRRYVKLLWPIVVRMLESDQQIARQGDPAAKSAVLSFQHEDALQRTDFSTQFKDETTNLPLGESPIVLAKIQLKQRPDGTSVLCMHPDKGEGIELAMNTVLLHSFAKLLTDAVALSEWELDLGIGAKGAAQQTLPERMN